MVELLDLTAGELRERVAGGEVTAGEVAQASLLRIEQTNSRLNSFLSVDAEGVRQKARDIDRRIQKGRSVGSLAGVPVGLKDNLCLAGRPATCASP